MSLAAPSGAPSTAPASLRPTLASAAMLVALLAVAGVLLFGVIHALVIVPIWWRLPGGLPFALLDAAAMVWAFTELGRGGRLPGGVRGGIVFGVLLWLAILPSTALGALFRVTAWHRRAGTLEVAAELVVAALAGALLGLLGKRGWRGVLAGAVVVTVVVLTMGGPIPVTNGRRPQLLWLSFLPLYAGAGALLALGHRRFGLRLATGGAS